MFNSSGDRSAASCELENLVRKLSSRELIWLRQQLLRQDCTALLRNSRHISQKELLTAEAWFWTHARAAHGARERWGRLRMWLIFMLLRYAALRLREIAGLELSHFNWKEGIISVSGLHARKIPLPLEVSHRLSHVLEGQSCCPDSGPLLHCDASLVRRTMQRCGSECGLPKGLLTARNIRYVRAMELGRQGLPLPALDIFLGRRPAPEGPIHYNVQEAWRILYQHIHKERHMQTSARNVFQGRITTLRQSGLLVEVMLTTAGGLQITALITDESCRRLALDQHTVVNASVKAPWVLLSQAQAAHADSENCFEAVVERVREDDMVMEILATLPEGSQVCALQRKTDARGRFAPGDKVCVSFNAFTVILNIE